MPERINPFPSTETACNVRDWLYVKDHCTAVWTIMKKGAKRGDL
jgi:dTDP-glucose 4,6-dehydratase